jgi:RNA polymerase sigma factor (sigma-70 family)
MSEDARAGDVTARLRALVESGAYAAAAALLSRTYGRRLRGFVGRLFADSAEADDVVQEVWLAVLAGLRTFRFEGEPKSWLFRVALRKAIDEKRRRRSFVELDSVLMERAQARAQSSAERRHRPDRRLSLLARQRRALAVLEQLSERDRLVVTLLLQARLKPAEVAEATGTSEVNVRKIKSRVIETILAAVDEDGGAESGGDGAGVGGTPPEGDQ